MSNAKLTTARQGEDAVTTASGIPVADNQNSLSAGPRGPLLLQIGRAHV